MRYLDEDDVVVSLNDVLLLTVSEFIVASCDIIFFACSVVKGSAALWIVVVTLLS